MRQEKKHFKKGLALILKSLVNFSNFFPPVLLYYLVKKENKRPTCRFASKVLNWKKWSDVYLNSYFYSLGVAVAVLDKCIQNNLSIYRPQSGSEMISKGRLFWLFWVGEWGKYNYYHYNLLSMFSRWVVRHGVILQQGAVFSRGEQNSNSQTLVDVESLELIGRVLYHFTRPRDRKSWYRQSIKFPLMHRLLQQGLTLQQHGCKPGPGLPCQLRGYFWDLFTILAYLPLPHNCNSMSSIAIMLARIDDEYILYTIFQSFPLKNLWDKVYALRW